MSAQLERKQGMPNQRAGRPPNDLPPDEIPMPDEYPDPDTSPHPAPDPGDPPQDPTPTRPGEVTPSLQGEAEQKAGNR